MYLYRSNIPSTAKQAPLILAMFSSKHRADCERKQQEIKNQRQYLPPIYTEPLTEFDEKILALSLSQVVSSCNSNHLQPCDILHAYGKRAILAHDSVNCLADIMFDEIREDCVPADKPLSGIVVSLKDCIDVAGHDTTLGYSSRAGHPKETSAPLVRLLRDAGAMMPVKTTVPAGLLSIETKSDLFGETANPYNTAYSPGASTGGGCALLAYQGSVVEVATDIGGSVRFPAGWCGVYSVKGSVGRFPAYGCMTCAPGNEGAPTVTAPIARTLDDLEEFWKRVVQMEPWRYDHTCIPLAWRPVDFVLKGRKAKWGVLWSDGLIPPSPAVVRGMRESIDALRRAGHEVVDFFSPSVDPVEGLKIGFQLAFCDGGASLSTPLRRGEFCNGAQALTVQLVQMPYFMKLIYALWLRLMSRPAGRNDRWAELIEVLHTKSVAEVNALIVAREAYKAAWFARQQEQGIDFIITPVHALPAIPLGMSGVATLVSAGSAFLFNVLDVTAGVQPVTHVDERLDRLPADFQQSDSYLQLNDAARSAWSLYDASAMHGLPVAVQVVGGRLEEEKVLAGMKVLERALWDAGKGFLQKKF